MAATVPFYFPSEGNAPLGLPEALAIFAQRRAQQMPAQQPAAPQVAGGGFWNSPGVPLPSLAQPQQPPQQQPQQAMAYAPEPPKPAMPAAVEAMPPAAGAAPAAEGGNWWEQFSNSGGRDFLGSALTDIGAGLASGRDWQEGLGIATQRMAELGPQRQQNRQAQKQQNATLEYLAREAPDLAEMVAAGMPVTAALGEALRRRTPTAPEMTANQRDFMFAQDNPEFGQFLNPNTAPKPTAGIQEYEYAKSQGYDGTFQEFQQTNKRAPMNATIQKELFETDEGVLAGQAVVQALDRALTLNDTSWDGPMAEQRAYGAALFGNQEGTNTLELKNLVTSQALDQLKATFGAMPTEGERKILLEIQGSVDQPKEVRRRIFERAKAAADRRIKTNIEKARALRTGAYFEGDYGQGAAPVVVDDLLEKYR